jgi:hypothetical protein
MHVFGAAEVDGSCKRLRSPSMTRDGIWKS